MTGREQGAPKPIRHPLGTVTSAEGTRLSSSNRPDQAEKYGREHGVQVEARTLCAEHGIPDCSPLLNGCTVQHETPPETQALLDLTLTRLLNMSVRPTYPTSFVPIGGWHGVDAAAVSLLEGRGLAIVSRGEARLTKAGVEAATDLVTLTGGGAS